MNNSKIIFVLLSGLLALTGCKKYLDVQPEAAYTEGQVYGNQAALQQALNGLYLDMADNNLYGAGLSLTTVELLAQRYKPVSDRNGTRNLSSLNNYQYDAPEAQGVFDSVWRKGYSTILAANVFLSKIDNSIAQKVLSQSNGSILKGEALAIRAMIHFDLLRLFGPQQDAGAASPAIPYYTEADGKLQPILSFGDAMQKIIQDLTAAAGLLSNDPVTTSGVMVNNDFYSGFRNQRLNYYAVKALLARAHLWQGKTQEAHDAALAVIEDGEKWFPWTTYDDANAFVNPDRVFSSEMLFAVYNPQLYNNYNLYFSPSLSDGIIMVPDSSRLREVFESNQNDYRYSVSWKTEGKSYPTFFKYADVSVPTIPWRFLQPLIRKSEIYLILAETETDPIKGLDYLNTERRKRGLTSLDAGTSLSEEIRKEYQKEFFGEGQLFFYYKRINAPDVPSAEYPYPGFTVTPSYKVPLPLSEIGKR